MYLTNNLNVYLSLFIFVCNVDVLLRYHKQTGSSPNREWWPSPMDFCKIPLTYCSTVKKIVGRMVIKKGKRCRWKGKQGYMGEKSGPLDLALSEQNTINSVFCESVVILLCPGAENMIISSAGLIQVAYL